MKSAKYIVTVAMIATAVAAAAWLTWSALGSLETRVAWCEIEAPERAAAGETIEVAVRYRGIAPAVRLSVDLHWEHRNGTPMGFLAHGGPRPEIAGDGERRFLLTISPREGIGHVRVVVYLGATGYWSDRTRAALSDPIPVMPPGTDTSGVRRGTHAPYDASPDESGTADDTYRRAGWETLLVSAFYLAAAVLCGRCAVRQRRQGDAAGRRAEWMWWTVAAALILSGAFAVADVGGFIAGLGREAARGMGLYLERRTFQKAAIAAIAAAAVLVACLLVMWLRASSRSLRAAFLGTALLLGLACVRSFSFHGLDALDRPLVFHLSPAWLAEAAVLIIVALAAHRYRITRHA